MDRNRVIADDADGPSPSERVVDAVAEATATDPLELEPLYDVIDPDALDGLFRSGRGNRTNGGRIQFDMAGCEVVVESTGRVTATPADGQSVERPASAPAVAGADAAVRPEIQSD